MAGEKLNAARWLLGGVGIGAGISYLLDPQQGRRRRALLRDTTTHTLKQQRELLDKGARDIKHRAIGAVERARSAGAGPADDAVLAARVRSHLGHYVSHPSAIEVRVSDGRVTLSGPVLTREARRAARGIRRVRGVRQVEDRLERHDRAGRIPGLQGAGRVPRAPLERDVWPPSLRVLALGSGAALGAYGLSRGGFLGKALSLAGGVLALRGASNLTVRRLTGVGAGMRAVDLKKSLYIDAPVEQVFDFWTRLENFPRFMEHVQRVHLSERDGNRSRWTVEGPGGAPVSFEAEVTRLVPNRMFAWKTLPNPVVQHTGVVHFQPEGEGTRLHIQMGYTPPAGAIGHALLTLIGSDPKARLDDDLLRLKALIEQGQTRAHGERVRLEELRRG